MFNNHEESKAPGAPAQVFERPDHGVPVSLEERGLNPSKLEQALGLAAGARPDAKAVAKAIGQAVSSEDEAMLAAAAASGLWVPAVEALSHYANPAARAVWHDHGLSDAAGTSANAPDSADRRAFHG